MLVEEHEDACEEEDEEDGGEGGGLPPFPLPPPPEEPSPFGGLELSPYNLVFLSSYRTFTIFVISKKAFLKIFSSFFMFVGSPS